MAVSYAMLCLRCGKPLDVALQSETSNRALLLRSKRRGGEGVRKRCNKTAAAAYRAGERTQIPAHNQDRFEQLLCPSYFNRQRNAASLNVTVRRVEVSLAAGWRFRDSCAVSGSICVGSGEEVRGVSIHLNADHEIQAQRPGQRIGRRFEPEVLAELKAHVQFHNAVLDAQLIKVALGTTQPGERARQHTLHRTWSARPMCCPLILAALESTCRGGCVNR